MVNLKAQVSIFVSAAIFSSVLFYINWKAAKSFIRKLGNVDADFLDNIETLYAFISVILITILSSIFAGYYIIFLQYFNRSPFGILDPIFGNDVSFYVFTLPVIHKLLNFAFWIFAILLVADIIICFFASKIEDDFDKPLGSTSFFDIIYKLMTKFGNSSKSSEDILVERDLPAIIRILCSGIMFIIGLKIYLSKYNLITATGGSNFLTGAGQNDLAAFPFWLPVFGGLIILLGIITLSGVPIKNWNAGKKYPAIFILLVIFIVGSGIVPSLWSSAYYKLNVVSSEQQIQMPYIEDSINYTRAAYDLNDIDEEYYPNNIELNDSIKSSPSIINARIFYWRAMVPFL